MLKKTLFQYLTNETEMILTIPTCLLKSFAINDDMYSITYHFSLIIILINLTRICNHSIK